MMIGTIVLIIWVVIKYGLDKIPFNGWWVFWAYAIEIGFYILIYLLIIVFRIIGDKICKTKN